MPYKWAAVIAAAIFFAACAVPRIDGTTEDSTSASIRRVRAALPETKRAQFDAALTDVMSKCGEVLPLVRVASVRQRIAGKNAAEIFAEADALRAAKAKRVHERELENQLADIHRTFERIESKDVTALEVSSAPATGRGEVASPAVLADPSLAIYSEKPLTDDRRILAYCARYPEEQSEARRQCELDELTAKSKLSRGLPEGVSNEIGARIRVDCARRLPSFRMRAACEAENAKIMKWLALKPELIDQLPPDKRVELEPLLKRQ